MMQIKMRLSTLPESIGRGPKKWGINSEKSSNFGAMNQCAPAMREKRYFRPITRSSFTPITNCLSLIGTQRTTR
jgi:hypothetical protein